MMLSSITSGLEGQMECDKHQDEPIFLLQFVSLASLLGSRCLGGFHEYHSPLPQMSLVILVPIVEEHCCRHNVTMDRLFIIIARTV